MPGIKKGTSKQSFTKATKVRGSGTPPQKASQYSKTPARSAKAGSSGWTGKGKNQAKGRFGAPRKKGA